MKSKLNIISYNFANGVYRGRLNSNRKPHGRGKMKYSDGSVFDGFFCNGLKHGNGMLTFPSGNKYCGQFFNDYRKGYGEFYYSNTEECYIGYWNKNLREGRGEYRFKDGSIFKGIFKNDLKHGVGKKISKNMVYTGHWKNGNKNGMFKFKHLPTGKETLIKYVDDKRVQVEKCKKNNLKSSHAKNSSNSKTREMQNIYSSTSKKNSLMTMNQNIPNLFNIPSQKPNKNLKCQNKNRFERSTFQIDPNKRASIPNHEPVYKTLKRVHLPEIKEVSENKISINSEEQKVFLLSSFDKLSGKQGNNEKFSVPELKINDKSINQDRKLAKQFSSFHELKVLSDVKQGKCNSILLGEEHQHFERPFIENEPEEDLNKCSSIDLNCKGIINPSFK
jgi:hypothetical protein